MNKVKSPKANPSANLLFTRLKVSGLLSFGPDGVDLPMRGLNILIGANASGKSNLLEVLALLRAAPMNLPAPVKEMGGIREWLWKSASGAAAGGAEIEAVVTNPATPNMNLKHSISIREHGSRFEVADERVENEAPYPGKKDPYFHYRFQRGHPVLLEANDRERKLKREQVRPEESVLSQFKDPERYPGLARLQESYSRIQFFRNWSFGPAAAIRRDQSTHERGDLLEDGGGNLAVVLQNMLGRARSDLRNAISLLYDGAEDLHVEIEAGNARLFLVESGGRMIRATRLSDGTLRYLCLLAILLNPAPPPLIAMEEPELGLHPDLVHPCRRVVEARRPTHATGRDHAFAWARGCLRR